MNPVDMRFHAPTVCDLFHVRRPQPCQGWPVKEIVASMGCPRLLMTVVLDGFGTAALQAHQDQCPNLSAICSRHYCEILSMKPPKTPVNFATMATGASQRVHGIEEKTDPLKVETLFEVFDESGLPTCVGARRSGSPAFLFSRMARYPAIAQSNTDAEVLDLALKAVDKYELAFALLQFLDIDEAEHEVGPFGRAVSKAVSDTDERLGNLIKVLAEAGGAVMVLADHGQHEVVVEGERGPVTRGRHDGTSPEDFFVPLAWCNSEELALLSRSVD